MAKNNWIDQAMRTTENAIVMKTTKKSMDIWSEEEFGNTESDKLGRYRTQNRKDRRTVPMAVKILKEL